MGKTNAEQSKKGTRRLIVKLTITRFKNISDGTIGKFELHEVDEKPLLSGYTLEPAGEDCVTPGRDLRVPQGVCGAAWE